MIDMRYGREDCPTEDLKAADGVLPGTVLAASLLSTAVQRPWLCSSAVMAEASSSAGSGGDWTEQCSAPQLDLALSGWNNHVSCCRSGRGAVA